MTSVNVLRRNAVTPGAPRPRAHHASTGSRMVMYGLLFAYAAVAIGPLLFILIGSLRTTPEILSDPLGLPEAPKLNNYGIAWEQANLSTYLWNSLIVTVAAVALCATVSTLAAYVLARMTFWGRGILGTFFLSGLMLPFQLATVPIYHLLASVGLVNSRLGLVLVYAATGLPLAVFILAAFFRQLPGELEEAARLDGAGEIRLFFSVMLPLVRPALTTVAAITFVLQWNDFFFPLVLMRSEEKFTVTVGLTSFFGQYSTDVGPLFAGLVLAILPLLLLFSVAFRQIISGLLVGASK